jgi:OOP family OmpA-OmpF porin
MTYAQSTKYIFAGIFCATLAAAADTTQIKGFIQARSGASMLVQTADTETVTVLLTDQTEVRQTQGLLNLGRKELTMTSLLPGLPVQVEATKGDENQFVAKSVKFKSDDLKRAKAFHAGLHETTLLTQKHSTEIAKSQQDIAKSQQDIASSRQELESQKTTLQTHKTAIDDQQVQVTDHQKKLTQQQAAISAAVARFGQLDDYFILDEQTVYFANGRVNLEEKYKAPLLQLAEKAKGIEGFMIEVRGYASAVGNEAWNEKLSEDRADNVARLLIRQGQIPLTNMLAPAAMGQSEQIGTDRKPETQAQNRRVVVRILQNKAVAGMPSGSGS